MAPISPHPHMWMLKEAQHEICRSVAISAATVSCSPSVSCHCQLSAVSCCYCALSAVSCQLLLLCVASCYYCACLDSKGMGKQIMGKMSKCMYQRINFGIVRPGQKAKSTAITIWIANTLTQAITSAQVQAPWAARAQLRFRRHAERDLRLLKRILGSTPSTWGVLQQLAFGCEKARKERRRSLGLGSWLRPDEARRRMSPPFAQAAVIHPCPCCPGTVPLPLALDVSMSQGR